ncbi:hypothetical protein GGX14DRAFT_381492, partial [Mycena pura]
DPILWWGTQSPYATKSVLAASPNNAALIRMAQDFLGAPATSVDVEQVAARAFAHGGGMGSKRRHGLSPETIHMSACVTSWYRAGLIDEKEMIKKLGSRRSRKAAKASQLMLQSEPIEISDDEDEDEDA